MKKIFSVLLFSTLSLNAFAAEGVEQILSVYLATGRCSEMVSKEVCQKVEQMNPSEQTDAFLSDCCWYIKEKLDH
ncbi:MAG: hypothetical protein ACJ76H_07020 [Bacteriovoracaceae bacterium]